MLSESFRGAYWPLQDDARFLHRRCNDVLVINLICEALMKRLLLAPKASSAAFMDGAANARSQKPLGHLVSFELPRHVGVRFVFFESPSSKGGHLFHGWNPRNPLMRLNAARSR
jgi:hypothetical protein